MPQVLDLKGLTHSEAQKAINDAYEFNTMTLAEKHDQLKDLTKKGLRVLQECIREDREFAAIIYKAVIEAYPNGFPNVKAG